MNNGGHQAFLPMGWATAIDPASGRTYYACPSTGESRWDPPPQIGPQHQPNTNYQFSLSAKPTFPVQYELEQPQYQQTTLPATSYHNPEYVSNPQMQEHQQPQYQQQLAVNMYQNQNQATNNPHYPQHQQELNNYTLHHVQSTPEVCPSVINTVYHRQVNNELPVATGGLQPEGSFSSCFTLATNQRANPTCAQQLKLRQQNIPDTSASSITVPSEGLFVAQARAIANQLKDFRETNDPTGILGVENTQQSIDGKKIWAVELSAFTAGQIADLHSIQQQHNIEQQSRKNGDGTNNDNDNMNITTLDFYYKPIDPFQLDIRLKRDYMEPGRIETRLHSLFEKLKTVS